MVRKETRVRGERNLRLVFIVALVTVALAVAGWGLLRGSARAYAADAGAASAAPAAQQGEPVGRYQVAVPDLVLDTSTGRLVAGGQVLEPPIDPSGKEVGRYTVDGFVTSVTRSAGLNVMNVPTVAVDLVRGYVIADTRTGRILRQRTDYSGPMQPGDL